MTDLREKDRVKEKRLKMKRKRTNEEQSEDENGVVCTLGNVQDDEMESFSSSNDDSSNSDSGSDNDEEGIVKGYAMKGAPNEKASRGYDSSSNYSSADSSDDDSDDEPMSKKRKELTSAELRAQEALVLKMMK